MTEPATDWRGAVLDRIRALVAEAVPQAVEEVKWRKPTNPAGVPVWSHAGILCTGETYRGKVKLTFPNGAALRDPAGLFNAGLEGNRRRAIDIAEDAALDEAAFKALLHEAAALNAAKGAGAAKAAARPPRRSNAGGKRGNTAP